MTKQIDTSFLDNADPRGDRGIRFYLISDEPDIIRIEVDIDPPGAGTLRLRLSVDDCLKLGCRAYAVARQAQGVVPDNRGRAN